MRKSTPTFVVKIRIYTTKDDAKFIDKKMYILNRMYNSGVRYVRKVVARMKSDKDFILAYDAYKKSDESNKKEASKVLSEIINSYGLSEYALHKWFGIGRNRGYKGSIGSAIVQKLASELYKSVQKAIFKDTEIHFRKFGDTNSFCEKSAKSGIIYNEKDNTVKVMGRMLNLKPIRETDYYIKEALTNRVKYCGIKREPFGISYKYFLLIYLEGEPPQKLTSGKGTVGIDEGTSTIATYGKDADFQILAQGFEKYNKDIVRKQRNLERKREINNPECYNPNGTAKKGAKFHHTKGMKRDKMRLKSAYRKKTDCVKQKHNYYANRLVEKYDCIVKEPMDFKALAKKSKKKTERSDKTSVIKKDNSIKLIHKFKRKKRYGKSINNRSPGYLNSQMEKRIKQYGGKVININLQNYKASQYDHITQTATKPKLSDRGKIIGGFKVQRDLYSAFLLRHMKDEHTINFNECAKDFHNFLNKQQLVIDRIKVDGDETKNFGIQFFLEEK